MRDGTIMEQRQKRRFARSRAACVNPLSWGWQWVASKEKVFRKQSYLRNSSLKSTTIQESRSAVQVSWSQSSYINCDRREQRKQERHPPPPTATMCLSGTWWRTLSLCLDLPCPVHLRRMFQSITGSSSVLRFLA